MKLNVGKIKQNPVHDFEQNQKISSGTLRKASSMTRVNTNVNPLIKLFKCI